MRFEIFNHHRLIMEKLELHRLCRFLFFLPELALFFFYSKIINASISFANQTILIKFPVFITIGSEPNSHLWADIHTQNERQCDFLLCAQLFFLQFIIEFFFPISSEEIQQFLLYRSQMYLCYLHSLSIV